MSARIARHLGRRVIGIDRIPERLEMARHHGIEVLNADEHDDVAGAIRDLTDGRGPDSVIDAVGMEAHGSPVAKFAHTLAGLLPSAAAAPLMTRAGIDRLAVLKLAVETVRRGGTISISGVYAGMADPLPMLQMFDKGVRLHMGQANVRRWIDDLMPLVTDDTDPLGTMDLTTHRMPLDQGPRAYEMFQNKRDGAIKILLKP
jgi:threonine dehydrogenase-like Zn-dependent dehydrogenase